MALQFVKPRLLGQVRDKIRVVRLEREYLRVGREPTGVSTDNVPTLLDFDTPTLPRWVEYGSCAVL